MRAKGRISSRDNMRKGLMKVKLLIAALLLGLFTGGVYAFAQSSFFDLRAITFFGNKHLSEDELKALMGIEEGEKIWRVSLRELAESLSYSPWIKDLSLRKEYPRSLHVRIVEAVPVALLKKGRSMYLIDDEGMELEGLEGESVPFLPIIVGDPAVNSRAFSEAVSLAEVIRDFGLSAKKGRVEIKGMERGVNYLEVYIDKLLVKVGQGEYDEKLSRLFDLTEEIRRRDINVEYVDLRFEDRVVVRPAKEVTQ
jgi:cell division protein FtsQ